MFNKKMLLAVTPALDVHGDPARVSAADHLI